MTLTRKIAGYTFQYGSAQILVMASGIISMPILTRAMSETEYGLMNIIGVTLILATTVFSGGLHHSLNRFYGESRKNEVLNKFLGTYLFSVSLLAVLGVCVVVTVFFGLAAADIVPPWALPAALVASPLIFVRQGFTAVASIYRMRERVITYNLLELSTKYLAMGLCIWLVLSATTGLLSRYFLGLVIGEATVLTVLCVMFFRRPLDSPLRLSRDAASQMFGYGLPLMAGSLAVTALRVSDRYLIKLILGAEQVAQYSVGSQLASYTSTAIVSGFNFGLVPVIMNAWGSGERQRAESTLGDLARYYALAAFPIALGLIAVRFDLIRLMASAKYLPGASVMPLVVGAALLAGFEMPLLIGLHFAKRTGVLAVLAASMAVLNILLNLVLIPMHGPFGGIVGAGVAVLTCSVLYLVIGHVLARKHYSVVIPWLDLARYAAAAAAMYVCVANISLPTRYWVLQLVLRIAAGVVIYIPLVLALDRRLRTYLIDLVRRRISGPGPRNGQPS